MKQLVIILFLIGLSTLCFAQQTIYGSITHDEMLREYILYIPANYTGNSPVPLILNFHGYNQTADYQMEYGDFRSIADSSGFLIVHPQGTLFQGITHWNVGGWIIGSPIDDVGFTEALLDSLSSDFSIDSTRIYSTGFSNGGYMGFLLVCQLSDRIAAIASVAGSMTPETLSNSNPQHPTPIIQMHGDSDTVVPYNGTWWSEPIEDVIQYWVGYNNCNATPTITELPDIDPNDGSTIELIAYDEGDNGVSVEHYKVIDGGHSWPGTTYEYGLPYTNYDINASEEIWNFFSRYDINGLINPVGIEVSNEITSVKFELSQNYPNPFNPETTISFSVTQTSSFVTLNIYNIKGQQVKQLISEQLPAGQHSVIWNGKDDNGKFVSTGIYFYKLKTENFEKTRKMILLK
ncbi:MAG: hypothetical protein DRH89_01535 [Candidatus Cloacimonadota bacterium]|nr:MAG: hypothetical protein DRH89_01535 [Candidatus Cloacimonadota bacterium]